MVFILFFLLSNMFINILFTFFFFNHTATTEIYTLSLHDALPILVVDDEKDSRDAVCRFLEKQGHRILCAAKDRKSTRLNSSHEWISYAVFCLKKKKAYLLTSTFFNCIGSCNIRSCI